MVSTFGCYATTFLVVALAFFQARVIEGCEEGWRRYHGDNKCMLLEIDDMLSWQEAQDKCKEYGGNLVVIKDEYKNNFVKELVPKSSAVWIGLKNVGANAEDFQFKYVDGSELGKFHPWESGSPNNFNNVEKCVTLDYYIYPGSWDDMVCSSKKRFVCERNANTVTD